MSESFSFGQIHLHAGTVSSDAPRDDAGPFRILVLGDFSGRASRHAPRSSEELAATRPLSVDVDDFDTVMQRLGAAVEVRLSDDASDRAELTFGELDDFHPDRLFAGLDVFARLRALRRRLLDPATFSAAAAELRSEAPGPPEEPAASEVAEPAEELGEGLLDTLIHETTSRESQRGRGQKDPWDRLVRGIVAPYLVPATDPEQAELVASVDRATSDEMRRVLRDSGFRSLEASWRAVHFLLRRLEVGVDLQLWLWDISREELIADLTTADDLERTATYRVLVESTLGTPGGVPYAVWAGLYCWGGAVDESIALGRIAKIAQAAGGPFVSAADPRLVGCDTLVGCTEPNAWGELLSPQEREVRDALRALPEAACVGLALPRFLLRLPYGKSTQPTEHFHFHELDDESHHEAFLWANAAVACVALLGQAYQRYGWNFRPGMVKRLEGLPLHIRRSQGEAECLPCAEVLLSDRAADRICERGVMPLQSIRDRDAVELYRFCSLAADGSSLAGRWRQG